MPNTATAPMVSGMAITSSRVTPDHDRHVRGRSSLSPVANRAITIANSLTRSSNSASEMGSSQPTPDSWITTALPTPSPR